MPYLSLSPFLSPALRSHTTASPANRSSISQNLAPRQVCLRTLFNIHLPLLLGIRWHSWCSCDQSTFSHHGIFRWILALTPWNRALFGPDVDSVLLLYSFSKVQTIYRSFLLCSLPMSVIVTLLPLVYIRSDATRAEVTAHFGLHAALGTSLFIIAAKYSRFAVLPSLIGLSQALLATEQVQLWVDKLNESTSSSSSSSS